MTPKPDLKNDDGIVECRLAHAVVDPALGVPVVIGSASECAHRTSPSG